MAPSRYTPAPNAESVADDDTAILYSHFCVLYGNFLSLTHKGDSWIYSTTSSWHCVVLNKAFCSRQTHCMEVCTSYRWGTHRLIEWVELKLNMLFIQMYYNDCWSTAMEMATSHTVYTHVKNVFSIHCHFCSDLVKLCIFPSLEGSGQGFLLLHGWEKRTGSRNSVLQA